MYWHFIKQWNKNKINLYVCLWSLLSRSSLKNKSQIMISNNEGMAVSPRILVSPVFSHNLLLYLQWRFSLELKQSHCINKTQLNTPTGSREIQLMWLHRPASVLATGSTSGYGCSLPEPTTANTLTGASSIHTSVTERGAAVLPPGRPTTLHLLEQNCTSPSGGTVYSGSVTKMFAVAEKQLVFGWNCWSNGATERANSYRRVRRKCHANA